jgi:DNA-binding NarL/FixJ family response regulator
LSEYRLVVVDDHELLRQGIVALLNEQPDMKVIGQAADGFEALTLARDLEPDLILMDVNMPICNGVEATRRIRAAQDMCQPRIVMLTIHDEDQVLFDAIRAGANGYLLKDTKSAPFLQAVRAVLAGEAALPSKLTASLLDEFARLPQRPSPGAEEMPDLTARERDVLNLIAEDLTDKEIAARLSLSVYTVKSHVRSILGKMQSSNRRQAARLAAEKGMLSGD